MKDANFRPSKKRFPASLQPHHHTFPSPLNKTMAKDKSEKKEKKEKKEKRSEVDGVKKPKKEKKEKKVRSPKEVDAILEEVQPAAAVEKKVNGTVKEKKSKKVREEVDVEDMQLRTIPKEALVPFANPLADEKVTKKVLKGVKKGMLWLTFTRFVPHALYIRANTLVLILAAKQKVLKRGVKEVVKSVRKTENSRPTNSGTANPPGIVILAADISPMDVISHIPVLCEDHNIPYIYVQSRAELGMAGNTKRPTSVVMVSKDRGKGKEVEDADYKEAYAELLKVVLKAGGSVRI
jgi:H/ACA ribonucleoprotein complex subunit 2